MKKMIMIMVIVAVAVTGFAALTYDNCYYDIKGNLVYHETDDFYETWDYDDQGNEIYYYDSYNDYEEEAVYDENGNMIYYQNSNNETITRFYNEDGSIYRSIERSTDIVYDFYYDYYENGVMASKAVTITEIE